MLLKILNALRYAIQPLSMVSWLAAVFWQGQLQQYFGLYTACVVTAAISLVTILAAPKFRLRTLFTAPSRVWIIWPIRIATVANVIAFTIAACQANNSFLIALPFIGQLAFLRLYLLYRDRLGEYAIDWNGVNPIGAWYNPPLEKIEPGDSIVSGHGGARKEGSSGGHAEKVGRNKHGRLVTYSSYMNAGMAERDLEAQLARWNESGERYFVLKPVNPETGEFNPLSEEEIKLQDDFFQAMWWVNKTEQARINRRRRALIGMLPISLSKKKWLVKKRHWTGYNWRALVRQDFTNFKMPKPGELPRPTRKSWTCVSAVVELSYAVGRVARSYGRDIFGLKFGVVKMAIRPLELLYDPGYAYLTLADKAAYEAEHGIKLFEPPTRKVEYTMMDKFRLWCWGVYV
jgi:hypothetical protein